MADVTYGNDITGLVVIDLYNDFISEGGKVWDRLKGVAEANGCVPHMMQVLDAARKTRLRVFCALQRRYRTGDYEVGSTLCQFKKQRGRERLSNMARGAARSVANSHRNRVTSWLSSIGVPAVLPTPIWICSSRDKAFISLSSWT